jgi:lipopolysaccharide export LptBFGC system permease protein LptF
LNATLIFAAQNRSMDQQNQYQQEYNEELEKVQDQDFTHNWVSSSAFIFYLSVFCLLAFSFGSCFRLYTQGYERDKYDVTVPDNTRYVPAYK